MLHQRMREVADGLESISQEYESWTFPHLRRWSPEMLRREADYLESVGDGECGSGV